MPGFSGVNGEIILKRIFRKWDVGGGGGLDWIVLAQYRDRWRAIMNEVVNFRVPYNAGNFLD